MQLLSVLAKMIGVYTDGNWKQSKELASEIITRHQFSVVGFLSRFLGTDQLSH